MDAMEFITRYEDLVKEIATRVHPDYLLVIDLMNAVDPHDLISPEYHFNGINHARGYVWSAFLDNAKQVEACWEESSMDDKEDNNAIT